jgi:hypothetical protein
MTDSAKWTSLQFSRTEPSALALPQRVDAELSDRRRMRTPRRGKQRAALFEDPACLPLQPALHRFTQLLGRRAVQQTHVQGQAGDARQRVAGAVEDGVQRFVPPESA